MSVQHKGPLSHGKPGIRFEYDGSVIKQLFKKPNDVLSTTIDSVPCTFQIISPHYAEIIVKHYASVIEHDLDYYHGKLNIPALFTHFGIRIEFSSPTELHLHDKNMILPDPIKELLKYFGVVILHNAFLDYSVRDMGHRNRFPQLNFHVDRIPSQLSYYSAYTRNPFDDEQKYPRTSSTLFIPTLVAYFQGLLEGKINILSNEGLINNCELFTEKSIVPVLDSVVIQHTWDKPTGTGELSIINNCNMLHASYYPNILNKGYRIGVRYLA